MTHNNSIDARLTRLREKATRKPLRKFRRDVSIDYLMAVAFERIDRRARLACRNIQIASGIATPPEPIKSVMLSRRYRVIEIKIVQAMATTINTFEIQRDAIGCANEVWDKANAGTFRLVYEGNRFVAGVCWRLATNEEWDHAKQIAEL